MKDPNYKPQADFTDVAPGSYCYDAVQWAVANGITKGTDKTHFSPNAGCTRGQVVTFLWRAAGEPVVSGNVGFVDVAPGSYCYEAVKWAVANGITKGTDATHFSPNATCTRGQVVTFMYRAEGEPAVGGSNGFVDVAHGSYCYDAVKWAVANGITKGTDATHFSPNATCTRGQVVTFMYRAEGEPAVGGNVGFVDVAPGSYCYEAVKWAVANGITKGTDATHFSPNATCTRGQVVTFLYRAQ